MTKFGQKINRQKRLNPDCNICKVPLTDDNWYKSLQSVLSYKCKTCHNDKVKTKIEIKKAQLSQPILKDSGYTVEQLKLEPMEIPDWLKSRVRLG